MKFEKFGTIITPYTHKSLEVFDLISIRNCGSHKMSSVTIVEFIFNGIIVTLVSLISLVLTLLGIIVLCRKQLSNNRLREY